MVDFELSYIINSNCELIEDTDMGIILDESSGLVHFLGDVEKEIILKFKTPRILSVVLNDIKEEYINCDINELVSYIEDLLSKKILIEYS